MPGSEIKINLLQEYTCTLAEGESPMFEDGIMIFSDLMEDADSFSGRLSETFRSTLLHKKTRRFRSFRWNAT